MKNCPFCAEDIQVAATKCKHCGSDIAAAEAAISAAEEDEKDKKTSGRTIGIIGGGIYIASGVWALTEGWWPLTVMAVASGVVYYFIAEFCWRFGGVFANENQPSMIISSSNADIFYQRTLWQIAPFLAAIIGWLAVGAAAIWLGSLLPRDTDQRVEASSTQQEAVPLVPAQVLTTAVDKLPVEEAETPVNNASGNPYDDAPMAKPARSEMPAQPLKASFNCELAQTRAEKLICSNQELADADLRLHEAYIAVHVRALNQSHLRNEQQYWRSTVRDACKDVPCMLEALNDRIGVIANYN